MIATKVVVLYLNARSEDSVNIQCDSCQKKYRQTPMTNIIKRKMTQYVFKDHIELTFSDIKYWVNYNI